MIIAKQGGWVRDGNSSLTGSGGSGPGPGVKPGQDLDWSVAITDYGATINGEPRAHVVITITSRPTDMNYFAAWTFEGDDPPSDPTGMFENNGRNVGLTEVGNTTIEWFQEQRSAPYTLQVAVTSCSDTYFARPDGDTEVQEIVIPVPSAPDSVTSFSAACVLDTNRGGIPQAHYEFTVGIPNDNRFWQVQIFRRWHGASWELVETDNKEIFGIVGPLGSTATYKMREPWNLPEHNVLFPAGEAERHTFIAYTMSRAGLKDAGVVSNQVTVPANDGIDGSKIVDGSIDADAIGSVNADVINGPITADQIGSVNANVINGSITASQIGSVNASTITGSITAAQIGSVNASSISGGITASQITSVNASSITGTITADKIDTVNASDIVGTITATQIASVNATSIQGQVTATQIQSLNAEKITGELTAAQIATVNAGAIQGQLTATQIATVNATSLQGLITAAQIDTVDATDITGSIQAGQIGSVAASTITGQVASSQIASLAADKITGAITASQIGSVDASAITGTIAASQIGTVNASSIQGSISASQVGSINANTIQGVVVLSQIDPSMFGDGLVIQGSVIRKATDNSSNMLLNGSFEFVKPDGSATEWFCDSVANPLVDTTANRVHSGARSFRITGVAGQWRGPWTGPIAVREGEKFHLETFYYTAATSGSAGVGIRFSKDATWDPGQFTDNWSLSPVSSNAWTRVYGTATVPATYKFMWVFCITAEVPGNVWFDSVMLTRSLSGEQVHSINADTIVGLIAAAQIGSVNATSITGSIQANQLAGGITADKITSINAGTIGTGTLDSDRLPFKNSDNLLENGGFELDFTSYETWTDGISTAFVTNTTNQKSGAKCIAHSAGSLTAGAHVAVVASKAIPVSTTDRLGLEGWARCETGANGFIEIRVDCYDANMVFQGFAMNAAASASSPNVWQRLAASPDALPGSTSFVKVFILCWNHTSGGRWFVDDVILTRQIRGEQVEDAAIKANHIESVNATSIQGNITAAQIGSVNASTIQGQVTANQVASVNASSIQGGIQAGQISSVSASAIQGGISASQITSVNASAISGQISSDQILSIAAGKITGGITSSQINSVSAAAITGQINSSQIGSIAASSITIGLIQDNQIGSVNASKLTVGTINVSGGGIWFSGSGGITIAGGGNVVVTPGSLSVQSTIYNQSSGYGWVQQSGLSGYISGNGYVNANAGFRVNGTPGITQTHQINTPFGVKTLYVQGGLITAIA